MLLKLRDLIINTDQIIKAEFKSGANSALTIYMTDVGDRGGMVHNIVRLTGMDASLMWSALSQIAQPVVPS